MILQNYNFTDLTRFTRDGLRPQIGIFERKNEKDFYTLDNLSVIYQPCQSTMLK